MMFGEDYAYAVARIRVLETGLLNQAAIEQLLACQDEQQCLQILTEKGWGNGDPAAGADAILSREREKIWEIMDSLVADRSVFSVLSYQDLFHNMKAAVKASILQGAAPNIFFSDCSIDGEDMVKFLRIRNMIVFLRICGKRQEKPMRPFCTQETDSLRILS